MRCEESSLGTVLGHDTVMYSRHERLYVIESIDALTKELVAHFARSWSGL